MSAAKRKKSESVSLKTFQKWSFSGDFDVDCDEDRNILQITCKICSTKYPELMKEAKMRGLNGPPLDAVIRYVNGVSYVHKGNLEKHIRSGSLHEWAKKQSSATEQNEQISDASTSSSSTQPLMKFVNEGASKNYIRLFNTALEIIMAEKPFTDFPFAIRMQKRNGVNFMPGKDDYQSCTTFAHYIAEALRNDLRAILSSVNFMCGEMDGSEARKTKEEKELVYCKVVVRGQPCEFLLKCQRMSSFGDVDAKSTKAAFDDAFLNDYQVSPDRFNDLLISVCADGASVNMGRISGACTQLKSTRPWLLIIHCVNHRLELAIADAFLRNAAFKKLDEMMVNVYYLFRNSGKNKRIIQRLAQRLSVTWITFANVKGTRFQAHQYRGIKVMIINYLTLLLFAENMIESVSCNRELKAKLKGYHSQWRTYGYLGSLELYRQVLHLTTHASLTFQDQSIIFTDVMDVLDECKSGLQKIASSTDHEFPFSVQIDDATDEAILTVTATNLPASTQFLARTKMSDRQMAHADKCISKVTESFALTKVSNGKLHVKKVKSELIPAIVSCIDKRFTASFQEPVIQAMRITDHTTWDCGDIDFGKGSIRSLAEHFSVPLSVHNFNLDLALKELNGIKHIKATKFKAFQGKLSFWENIFAEYQHKFPHFLLLIELCLSMAFSSSTVERGFSTVKRHLTDARLSLTNERLNDLLVVRVNTPVLCKLDPDYETKLVKKAVDMYMNSTELKRGARYHKTTTMHAKSMVAKPSCEATKSPDLFLPVPVTSFIKTGTYEEDLLADMDTSEQEFSGSDTDSLSETDDVNIQQ